MTTIPTAPVYRPSETEREMQRLDYDREDGLIDEGEYMRRIAELLARFEAESGCEDGE